MLKKDIRDTDLYREAEAFYESLHRPGTGLISGIMDINASPDGKSAVFSGLIVDKLEGSSPTRVCDVDLSSGALRVLTFGPNTDRLPRYSPDGRVIAFLSDRREAGNFQLYLLDPISGAATPAPIVEGWIEYLHWSPDGSQILLGVASHGADIAGGHGAITSKPVAQNLPSWMPTIEGRNHSFQWRHAWIYDLATNSVRKVPDSRNNVWEAVWCGDDALAAVVSLEPGEGLWYTAILHIIDIETGESREIYQPKDQLGWPAGSPSGQHIAIVEAICSDRWIVAGELRIIDLTAATVEKVSTRGVDITCTEWRSDSKLLFAGHRGFETVVGLYDVRSGEISELWSSLELTSSGIYASVSGYENSGDFVVGTVGFRRAPEIAVVRGGHRSVVRSFDIGYQAQTQLIAAIEPLTWKARDGLEIPGWLLKPSGNAPHPLVMVVHGGPVSHWRPHNLSVLHLMLLKRGYALFLPNPRGSSGLGQEFIQHVVGDMGGADGLDCLSALDDLIERGVADPKRLGVTGRSYGGFMASWLITQDTRFAAAVPVAPVTNYVTEHLVSNIPHFVELFLKDKYFNPVGKYFSHSPVMHAHKVRTPTLSIAGALDKCTPAEEAVQFHNALLENGVESVLAIYPEEGHGVRSFPAIIDYTARVVDWFERHLGNSRN